MRVEVETLKVLGSDLLHEEARRRGRGLLRSHWAMAACLLAVERAQLHVEHGCSGVVQYAVRFLELDGHLAAELVRAARVLEAMPRLSSAFETGQISWSKVREVTRVAKPDDDAAWVAFAQAHGIEEICKRTVLSPRRWSEREAAAARAAAPAQMMLGEASIVSASAGHTKAIEAAVEPSSLGQSKTTEAAVEASLGLPTRAGATVALSSAAQGVMATLAARSSSGLPEQTEALVPAAPPARTGASAGTAVASAATACPGFTLPVDSPPATRLEQPHLIDVEQVASAADVRPAMPEVEPRIRLELRLTPEEYQIYQQVERSVRASVRRPMTKEAVFAEVCRRAQSSGERRPRIRTRVVVHYDRLEERGWLETSRGVAPVGEARLERALEEAESVMVAPSMDASVGQDALSTAEQPTPGVSRDAAPSSPDVPRNATEASPDLSPRPAKPSAEAPLPASRSSRGKSGRRRPAIPMAVLDALFARSGGCCEMPGCRRGGYLHVHHRLPWSRGGGHDLDNLLLVCSTCHGLHHRQENEASTPKTAMMASAASAAGEGLGAARCST